MDDLRARAGQVRRHRRRARAGAIVAALVVVAGGLFFATRSSSTTTLHTVGPVPSTSVATTTTTGTSTPAGTTYLPPQVSFADTANGWMAYGGSCSSGSCADPIMRHTTDGGQTWSAWPSVPATHDAGLTDEARRNLGGLVMLDFADPKDGWYGQGGLLWSTHDGGQNWERVDLAGPVVAMDSTGESSWALAVRCPSGTTSTVVGGTPSCPLVLLTTASDRDQWQEVAGSLPSSGGGDLVDDNGTVWILTGGGLFSTQIGGSVREVAPPCSSQPGMGPTRVVPIAIGRIGVLCTGRAVNGANNTLAKAVVESTDGGQHWRLFAAAPSTGWAGWATADYEGSVFVDTDGLTLWRSTGGPWSPVFRVPAPTGGMDQVLVVSPDLAYVVVDGGDPDHTVWVSHDGGRAWGPVPLS
jgi:photosystem II stability/assembly factor-like uncharacterized protein